MSTEENIIGCEMIFGEPSNNAKSKRAIVTDKSKRSAGNITQNTRLVHGRFTFGFIHILNRSIACLMLLLIVKLITFIIFLPKATRLTALAKTYIFSVQTWDSYFNMHDFAFQVILWNDTSPVWGGSSLETFEHFQLFIKDNIIPNYTEALTYDLGNYTDKYKEDVMIKKACGYAMLSLNQELCPDIYGGILNTNLLGVLKEMLITLSTMIEKWKDARHDWKEVRKILDTKLVQGMWAKYDVISLDIYYFIVLELTATVMAEIESNIAFSNKVSIYEEIALILWLLPLAHMLWKATEIQITAKRKAIHVTPFPLWRGNFKLNKYMFA